MATKKKLIPKYQPGDKVYAINAYKDPESGYSPDKNDTPDELSFFRIFKVYIRSIYIEMDSIDYLVCDKLADDSSDWGDTIPEKYVSSNIEELFKEMRRIWKI